MFGLEEVRTQIETLRPDVRILTVSALRGDGMAEWGELLVARLAAKRAPTPAPVR